MNSTTGAEMAISRSHAGEMRASEEPAAPDRVGQITESASQMNKPFQRGTVLVLGEALVDIIERPGQPDEVFPGGSPLNVAIGLQRLGVKSLLHSRFGTDREGDLIAAHLASSGVEIVPSSRDSNATSIARAKLQPDGSAKYVFDIKWDLQPLETTPADIMAVHTGSIGAILEPGASAVEREIERLRRGATVSYDPNIRPQLMGAPRDTRHRVERIVSLSDVVKASDEDLHWLYPDVDVRQTAREWLNLGPSLVAVTRGADGAHAVVRAGSADIDAVMTTTVDTVGAGDSFMAGLIAALAERDLLGRDEASSLRRIDLETVRNALTFAARCAAITVARRGANPPLRSDVDSTNSLAVSLPRNTHR